MYCDNNSNNFQDNCIINENKNCSDFSDYMNCNNKCNNNSSYNSNNINFSRYLPIIVIIGIFILFFCNNNKSDC